MKVLILAAIAVLSLSAGIASAQTLTRGLPTQQNCNSGGNG